MAFILRPFPRSIGVGKEYLRAPTFVLGEISKFRAVVNGDGFEHLGKAVTKFCFEYMHSRHNGLTGLS